MTTKSKTFQQVLDAGTLTSHLLSTKLFAGSPGGSGLTLTIAGTFVATLRLMTSPDDGEHWVEFATFTEPDVFSVPATPEALWKLDASGDGDFTSGSIWIEFARGTSSNSAMRLQTADRKFVSEDDPFPVTVVGGTTTSAATVGRLPSSGASATLRAANSARKGLIVQNTDDGELFLKYGAGADVDSFTVQIPAGGYWEMPQPVYKGLIAAMWTTPGSGYANYTEL